MGDEGLSVRKMDLELSLIGESQFITCCIISHDDADFSNTETRERADRVAQNGSNGCNSIAGSYGNSLFYNFPG